MAGANARDKGVGDANVKKSRAAVYGEGHVVTSFAVAKAVMAGRQWAFGRAGMKRNRS